MAKAGKELILGAGWLAFDLVRQEGLRRCLGRMGSRFVGLIANIIIVLDLEKVIIGEWNLRNDILIPRIRRG